MEQGERSLLRILQGACQSAVDRLISSLCGVFSLAGHRPQSGDGVIAEVALPRWRYVAGRGLHGRPSVRYRTCRLGAPDVVPQAVRAGAPSKDAWDGPLARRGQLIPLWTATVVTLKFIV